MEETECLFKGRHVVVYPLAKIISAENLFLDDYSIISDYCFILASAYIKIGKYSRMAPYSMITGGGSVNVGDFVDISYGVKIISGSDDIFGESLFTPNVPPVLRKVKRMPISIGDYTFIGANSIIYPGVTIGEGVTINPGTIVKKDLQAWSIFNGVDCRYVCKRENKEKIISKAHSLLGGNN